MHKDLWMEHYSLEITNSIGNDDRMILIAQTLCDLERNDLVPQQIAEPLFDQLARINE